MTELVNQKNLAESDAKRGSQASRTFIRMFTNILLYLAAVDDEDLVGVRDGGQPVRNDKKRPARTGSHASS